MLSRFFTLLAALFFLIPGFAQDYFPYQVVLTPVNVSGLPGIHSYAFAESGGKWLIIGGRRDGIHARQPANSFPASQNNREIFVIDAVNNTVWTANVNVLPLSIAEQLQSTNMNFHQSGDTLYIIGGYAFSASANDHITFPYLTTANVSGLIDAIVEGNNISPFFKQIQSDQFAVTGGQLNKLGDTFYLVGGHRFDGRYNPMGNPTFAQQYTNQIRKFKISNSPGLSFFDYVAVTDAVHLRRRDFNLVPQIFPEGSEGFMISSGVFQQNVDLPFLYPVEIREDNYQPITTFNQYLSNYHSPKLGLYDAERNQMHNLFFGGISQYYYQGGQLIQDNQVPFVKTISRVSRYEDGSYTEFQLPVEMPGLKGASAEFIPNRSLPYSSHGVVLLNEISGDSVIVGHILGGIQSSQLNPFSNNQTNTTSADPTIFAVALVKSPATGVQSIKGGNPFSFDVYPNPSSNEFSVSYLLWKSGEVSYFLSDVMGNIIKEGNLGTQDIGQYSMKVNVEEDVPAQSLTLTLVFDYRYFASKKIIKGK